MALVETQKEGQVTLLTLNCPDNMNAYNAAMHDELVGAIDAADNDPAQRVIVITGAGRAFCAGADISGGFGSVGGGEMLDGVNRDFGGMLVLRLFACDTPVIAAINGAAIGIGATMLLPMDIKIASERAKFAFPFGRRGIVFDGAASWFLPRIVGLSRAQNWIARGDIIKADEALAAGFVNELIASENVLERALETAHDIAINVSPTSAANNKRLIRQSMLGNNSYGSGPFGAHMAESVMLQEAFLSSDCEEGVKSFLEKRPPVFKDRQINKDTS